MTMPMNVATRTFQSSSSVGRSVVYFPLMRSQWTPSAMRERISDTANRPIIPATSSTPVKRSRVPNVKRGVPENGSVPAVAMMRPSTAEIAPLTRSRPTKLLISARPNTPRAKYSGGPKASATLESGTAIATRMKTLTMPPIVPVMSETPSAFPL